MKNISKALKKCKSVAIIIHRNPDGDCLGSASALAEALRNMGKDAYIFSPTPVPERIAFLTDKSFFCTVRENWDMCIAVDVAELGMMGQLKEEVFDKSNVKCCIDHHKTNTGYADINHIDSGAAATGEIIYYFIKDYLKTPINKEIAIRLYAAIVSDTGGLRYSNTTPVSFAICAKLAEHDFSIADISYALFEKTTSEQLALKAEVVSKLKFYADGKICIAYADAEMLSKYNLSFDDVDDLSSLPRTIDGVETGVYIKVKGPSECKVSLRSNKYVDVSKIAGSLGGGGHLRASGVTIEKSLEDTVSVLLEKITEVI